MPGELSDHRFLFPFHYDPRYNPGTDPFQNGIRGIDGYLQDIAKSVRGYKLSTDELDNLKGHLDAKGMLIRNPGDEGFRNEVICYLKRLQSAKKVAARCLISTKH